jgi:hypothetical protein
VLLGSPYHGVVIGKISLTLYKERTGNEKAYSARGWHGGALGVFLVAGVALAMTITGTNGSDNITATNKADNIAASANRDVVNGKGGPDRIFGDGGNDTLDGGEGPDHIESGDGNNVARGNDGDGDWVSVVSITTQTTLSVVGRVLRMCVCSGPGRRRARRVQRCLREGLPDCIDTAGVVSEDFFEDIENRRGGVWQDGRSIYR